jgi:cytochrome b561
MWRNSTSAWGAGARLQHWLGALLIAVLIGHGWWMTHQIARDGRFAAYGLHADIGYVFLALLLVRLVWKLLNPTPDLPAGTPAWERWFAHGVHWLLYGLMLATAVAGWGLAGTFRRPVGSFAVPAIVTNREAHGLLEDLHGKLSYALLAVVVLHVAAALWRHFVKKDDVLRRMAFAQRAGD